jgi:hypothetical protein
VRATYHNHVLPVREGCTPYDRQLEKETDMSSMSDEERQRLRMEQQMAWMEQHAETALALEGLGYTPAQYIGMLILADALHHDIRNLIRDALDDPGYSYDEVEMAQPPYEALVRIRAMLDVTRIHEHEDDPDWDPDAEEEGAGWAEWVDWGDRFRRAIWIGISGTLDHYPGDGSFL